MNEVSRAMTKDGILGDKSGDLDKIFNIMDNIFIPSNIPPLAQLTRLPKLTAPPDDDIITN